MKWDMAHPFPLRAQWRLVVVAALVILGAVCTGGSATPPALGSQSGELSDLPVTFEDRVWNHRVEAAFASSERPEPPEVVLPSGYYAGKLLDSHFHKPHIPDSRPGTEPGEATLEGSGVRRFQDRVFEREELDPIRVQQPLAGKNVTITELACLLSTDGTDGALAFFPVFPHIQDQLLDLAHRSMDEMVSTYPGLFVGYGELGLYKISRVRDAGVPPDAEILQKTYLVVENMAPWSIYIPVMIRRIILPTRSERTRTSHSLFHGDQIEKNIGDLMDQFSNIYYTFGAIYGDQYVLRQEDAIESFLAATSDYGPLIEADLTKWKDIIERYPDRFMWGTDRGGSAVWTYDHRVVSRLVDYARAFIGGSTPTSKSGSPTRTRPKSSPAPWPKRT